VPLFLFEATHGVQLGEPGAEWASFTRNETLDTPDGEKRYSFSTEDAAVAKRLRAVEDYGIAEVK
jgi:hypothetical protein